MLLSSPLLLFFVHFTSVLAFLCLSSLYLFFYFSCSLCLSLFLFLLVSLCIICVSSFFICVFLYYLFVVLPFFVAFVFCPGFSGFVFVGWINNLRWGEVEVPFCWRKVTSLYVFSMSLFFFWVGPGQPGSTHLTRDPITWPGRWPGWVSKLCNWVLLSFDVRSREFL
jgi:hypothetical protein